MISEKGIFEELYWKFKEKVKKNFGVVKYDYITEFIKTLQDNELDAHILITGQNGLGKSHLMLQLMKLLNPNSINTEHLLFAYHDTRHFINRIKNLESDVLGIDELKKFFHYKQSMATEQVVLNNYIEYARANRVAFIGCAKDWAQVNNNYREGKVQMVIWLVDRFKKPIELFEEKVQSYAMVFLGNPVIDSGDRFQFQFLRYSKTHEELRVRAEELWGQTFYGYFFIKPTQEFLTKEEIEFYKAEKKKGIDKMMEKSIAKLEEKEMREQKEKEREERRKMMEEYKRNPAKLEELLGWKKKKEDEPARV